MYIETDEEITSIVDRLKKTKEERIALVVPAGANLLSSVVNLKLLKQKASDLGKEVSVVTTDRIGRNLASQVGLTVYQRVDDRLVRTPKKEEKEERKREEEPVVSMSEVREEKIGGKNESLEKPVMVRVQKPFRSKKSPTVNLISREIVAGVLVVGLVLVVFVVFLVLPRADIILVVPTEGGSADFEISLDTTQDKVDLFRQLIPAKIFDRTLEESRRFSASGKKNVGQKASGVVTIINKTGQPQPLVSTTRLLSEEGILFRTTQAVNVPGASVSDVGEIVPGRANVAVIADQPGEEGNIGPGKFTIPGLPGRETVVYGVSDTAMTGGTTEMREIITSEDIEAAKQNLADILYEEVLEKLKKEAEDKIILDELSVKELLDASTNVESGAEVSEFEVTAKVKLSILLFEKKDFSDLFSDKIALNISPNKKIVSTDSDRIIWEVKEKDIAKGRAKLLAKVNYSIAVILNKDEIRSKIIAKSYKEAQEYLYSLPNIEKAEIKLWPAWVKSIPNIERNINLQVNYKS